MRALLVALAAPDPASLRTALAAALGATSVDLCQATEAAVTWLENRPCDLVAIAGQDASVVEAVTRLRRVSKTIPVLAVVPDPSAREAGAAWLAGADDVVTASNLVAGTLPEGLDEVRHPERDVLRKTQRLWYAGPADALRQQLATRLGTRFREVGLSAEGLAGLTTQDVEAPHSAALIVNAAAEPDALVLGVRRVKRTYPGLAITVVADPQHHDAFHRAGADECVAVPAEADPVLHAAGRAQAACRAVLELDTVRARETRLRALLEHLPEAVMLVSPEHAVLAVNLAALRLIGAQDARQVLGSPLAPWFEADDHQPDSAVALVDGVTGGAARDLVLRTRHLADPRRLQLRAVPFQRETGGPPAALMVLREMVETPIVDAATPLAPAEDSVAIDEERQAWNDERAGLQAQLTTSTAALASAQEDLVDAWTQKARLEEALLAVRVTPAAPAASEARVDVPAEHGWILRDLAQVGFIRATPEGLILECNDHAARLCGYRSAAALVECGVLPQPLTLLADFDDAVPTRFEVCLQVAQDQPPRWLAGARLPKPDDASAVTWLLADASAHRNDTAAGHDRPDTLNAVLEVVAAECAVIIDDAPVTFRGPRPIEPAVAATPTAAQALDRARVLLAQVSGFRRRRETRTALDELRAHLTALDPVLQRLATDDVSWELALPEEAVHVGASASDVERCVTALVTSGRDALPLGGKLTLSVRIPATGGAAGGSDVLRLDAHLVLDAQGYGVADIELPVTLHDLAASFGGLIEVVRVDALTRRLSLSVPRAFVVSHAA